MILISDRCASAAHWSWFAVPVGVKHNDQGKENPQQLSQKRHYWFDVVRNR